MSVTRPKHKYDQTREHEYDKTERVGGKCAPCSFKEVFLKCSQLQESHGRNHIKFIINVISFSEATTTRNYRCQTDSKDPRYLRVCKNPI